MGDYYCEYKECNNRAKYSICWDECDEKGEVLDTTFIDSCIIHILKLSRESTFGIPIDHIYEFSNPLKEYNRLKRYVNKNRL